MFASIGDDSHDAYRRPGQRPDADEMAPDAEGSADVPIREAAIYHQLARGTIEPANLAANQRQLHRLKVARRNESGPRNDGFPAGVTFFHQLELLFIRVRYAWRCGRRRDCFNARKSAQAIEHPIDLLREPRHVSSLGPTGADSERQYPTRLEAGIDARQFLEAA